MNQKTLYENEEKEKYDTLSLYHHLNCDFDHQLQTLLSVLDFPKEYNLDKRLNKVASLLKKTFCIELINRLGLLKVNQEDEKIL